MKKADEASSSDQGKERRGRGGRVAVCSFFRVLMVEEQKGRREGEEFDLPLPPFPRLPPSQPSPTQPKTSDSNTFSSSSSKGSFPPLSMPDRPHAHHRREKDQQQGGHAPPRPLSSALDPITDSNAPSHLAVLRGIGATWSSGGERILNESESSCSFRSCKGGG